MIIEHANLLQVVRGRDGRTVLVEDDVLDVVRRLQEVDPNLFVVWNEHQEYFTVVERCEDGRERLVTTTKELGPNLVEYVQSLLHKDITADIERMDDQATKDADWNIKEKLGLAGEKMYHALRKDLQAKNRIYLPRGIRLTRGESDQIV